MGYKVEDNCSISSNVKIGDNTLIKFGCVIEDDCVIGNDCLIGPFAHIHTHTKIGDNCVIGNFVEIKNSIIKDNVKAKHLVYIGDCECGSNVNFGCGVIIANFDGKNKHKTIIKDKAFIGCNSNLIAPVSVGSNTFIGASTTLTKDLNDNEFAITKREEIHKKNKLS